MKISSASKTHPLSRGILACVGRVATVNVAAGCAGGCLFCHARCYRGAPAPGHVQLYDGLPDQLRRWASGRHPRGLPRFVLFSTASDPFLGGPRVARVSHACLEALLGHRVGVSLSTRGRIPDTTLGLLARHRERVRVTLPIPSLDDAYVRAWEPGAEPPAGRLFTLQRLRRAGVPVSVRISPVIPFVNDGSAAIRRLASALVGLDVTRASLTFMHMRPGVADQLRREAPSPARGLVLAAYPGQVGQPPREFEHLPPRQALAALRRIQRVARERGLKVSACRCESPGLPATACPVAPPQPDPAARQTHLFPPARGSSS